MGEELSKLMNECKLSGENVFVTDRRVMGFSAFLYSGSPLPLLNPVKICRPFSSVRTEDTSSSRPMRLRSTHWSAAMEVMSLVHDARMNAVSKLIFSVGVLGPNAA
jgi:hypothetical protein